MPGSTEGNAAADMRGGRFAQVGIVVADAARTARRYAELFGIGPWMFFDFTASDVELHGTPLADADGCVRAAMANLGNLEIELLQPLYGPGTHGEFFQRYGEGIHHISFGMRDNHDAVVTALRERGIGIEMQGVLGGCVVFSYLDTVKELGTIYEVVKPPPPGTVPAVAPWGLLTPEKPARLNMAGKQIAQVGIVVADVEGTMRRYEELFGIGPWTLWAPTGRPPREAAPASPPAGDAASTRPPQGPVGILHGIPMISFDARFKIGVADWEGLQIELIEPLCGPGTHWEFLKTRGPGVHHLSFGTVDDHDAFIAAAAGQGIGVEMSGSLGRGAKFTYLDTRRDLGTIFEVVHIPPGVEIGPKQ